MFSNYTLKKILPRLILIAIAINVSYDLCLLMVDLSNFLGVGIGRVFASVSTRELGWADLIETVLVAGTASAIAILNVGLLVPIAITGFFALITMAMLLVIRQVMIILLIVVAPIALVAYILPNTESFAKSWWKMFYSILMIYPIAALLVAASNLAANVISSIGG